MVFCIAEEEGRVEKAINEIEAVQQNEEKEDSDLLLYEDPSLTNMDTDLLSKQREDRTEHSPSIVPVYRNKVSVSFFSPNSLNHLSMCSEM